MNPNFESILWFAGHFGICIREHIEALVYRNEYSAISANRTLSKLEKEYGYLKRIDRGKSKTNGYKLTPKGIKEFRRLFGYEAKSYNSSDKLNHSIQIANFYVQLVRDRMTRGLIKNDFIIIEEKEKIPFVVEKQIKFFQANKDKVIIPDGFCIYRYAENKGKLFYLEIENSDRKAAYVTNKTLGNYESLFLSSAWKKESWQPANKKIFPPVLIVAYSEIKAKQLQRAFKDKRKVGFIKYFFTDYKSLKEIGFSGKIWYNIDGEKVSFI